MTHCRVNMNMLKVQTVIVLILWLMRKVVNLNLLLPKPRKHIKTRTTIRCIRWVGSHSGLMFRDTSSSSSSSSNRPRYSSRPAMFTARSHVTTSESHDQEKKKKSLKKIAHELHNAVIKEYRFQRERKKSFTIQDTSCLKFKTKTRFQSFWSEWTLYLGWQHQNWTDT